MRFRLQCKRAMTVFLALLTVILAFCFMRPVSADQTVTPTSVTTVTNQPNAPNKGSQSTQSIAQASLATENSQQTNQSTSATVSDGANANKSATTAAKSAEDNLSAAKKNAQSTADQPQPTSGSNDSQTMNIRESRTTATPQTLAAEKATQATAGQEIQPTSINATITDASGNEIPAGQTPQVNQYSPLNIHFSFDLTGKNVQPGDYFNFTIGNSGDHLSVQNASIQLYDQNSKHIGYVDLTSASGQINGRVTFTTTVSDANGEFNVQLKVNGNNTSSGTTVPVTITLPNDHKITGEFKYVPGSDAPEEQFSKYSYNSKLGPDKSNPKATDPDYYTPDDITKGNLTYAIRLIHHHGDAEYTKAAITDQLQTPGFTYDQKSFLLYKTHWTYAKGDDGSYHWNSGSLHNIPSSDYTLTISADDRSFTMDFDTPTLGDGDGYIIFYRLLYNGEPVNKITNVDDKPADGTVIHNTAELNRPGGKTITYPQTMVISGSDGKAQVKFFTVTVTKTDQNNKPLAGATFQLIRNSDKSVVQTKTTGADGKLTFDRLLRDNYTLHELVAPSGYDLAKDVQISSDDFAKTHDYAVTIKDEVVPTTSVKVTKKWDDNNDQDGIRPTSVTVDLLVNGIKDGQSRVLNEDNNWTATFDNLPVSQNGEAIKYTVAEETIANPKYTAKVTGDAKSGFTITNTYTPATTSIKVTKSWNDNNDQDGIRPDKVIVDLLANGSKKGQSKELSKSNNWTATFDNLPVNQDGHAITYTVAEEAVANYTSKVTGDAKSGFTITNTYTPATTSIKVTKSWNDNDNQDGKRPDEVTVNLLVNGEETKQSIKLSKSNNWTDSFTNLPVYKDGKKINYTVEEKADDKLANYTSNVTGDATQGFTITNTEKEQPKPEVTSVTVTKKWDDNNNQDGLRKAVQVQLYQQNSDQTTPTSYGDTVELNDQNSWKTTWNKLPKYDKQGKLIKYTVKEVAVPAGYTSSLAGNAQDGFVITNTHTPATTSVKVTKNWDDSNDQDGLRPKSVTVHLMNGDQVVQTKVLNAENHWSATFDQLAVNEDGKPITYTVKEDEVANYTSAVTGDAKDGFTITNTHTPATTSVKVTKSWDDNNDQDGLRPEKVIVDLLANGSKKGQSKELSKSNNWTATFDNLPVNQDGHAIKYTVAEEAVANYTPTVTGNAKDGFTITNTHTPATTSIKVTKSWNDNNDQDGIRPKSVTVHLFANDSETDQYRVLNKGNNWTATFDNLPVSQNGESIKYTIAEDGVANYTSATTGNAKDGFTITNTHTPATISKSVTKQWTDNDNQDGIRPTSIKVDLLANDKVVKTVTLNTTNNWTATVNGLAQKANGQDIKYAWQEVDVPAGYQAKVDGDTITNTHTPATISKSVTKQWTDNDNQDGIRPTSIKVNLLANDKVVKTVTLNATNNWTATVNGLAQKAKGQDIKYTWQETNVPAGYQATVNGDTITNTHTPATTSLTVNKVWNDANNQDGLRPTSIKVNLLANGQVVKTVELTADGNWTAAWTGLPVYQAGKKISYTVEEANVPAGYQATVDGDTITNTHTPATISKSVTKQWVDNDNQDGIRPTSIKANLLANGKVVKTLTLNATNNWTATVSGLAQKAKGQDIKYTWQEADVPAGYQATVDGDTITNTHTPATIAKTVTKQWVDNDNQDGIRPMSIKVNLLANGKVVKTLTLSVTNNWTATVNGLAQKAKGQDIDYTWQEATVPAGYKATVNGDLITNTHTPATIAKTVTKQWADNGNQDGIRPTEITVNLLANGKIVKTLTLNATNNWTATVSGLAQKAKGQDIKYTWQEADVPAGYQATVDGDTITNTHTPATIAKTVTKQWVDNDNQDGIRPTTITVNLLANGKVVKTLTLSATNNWTATVNGLAQKAKGQDIKYAWQEADVPAGYQATVDGDLITNTHTPATIAKSVTKQWADNGNQDGIRPTEITVNLLANGKIVKTLTLNAADNWAATVTGLAQKANGQDIKYTWQEATVPAGYQAKVDGNTITNTHTPATISKSVTKQWVDNDNQDGIRPTEITVNLLANGKVVRTLTLNATNNWAATVTGLAQKAKGQDIDYTWQEADVPAGYQATVDGDLITNTHTPATTSLTVNKVWNDANNQDGLRPTSIKVNLLANGQVVKTVELTADGNWTAAWTDLPVYQAGKKITYTVEEANVPAGYHATVNGDTITNTHTPATISKSVTKQWVDNDNQDGIRPTEITVNLLANGKVVRTLTLSTINNWTATVNDLAQKANGQDIDYTWQEANVPAGYQATVNGDLITNTHTPATIAKTVTKQWVDNDNQDGIRPTEITVNLLANGKIVKTLTLSANNNWTATVTGLAQKANGQDIDYTWQEANVPTGYQSTVDGDLITNTHTPATIAKTVTKQWVDNDNQDGIRPTTITVNLLANGKVVRTLTLSAANNWTATVNDLAQKANGQDINYTWQEANIPVGYQSTVNGDTIINTHEPATTKVTVVKVWNDDANKDGLRPASVTINLLANGWVIRTAVIDAANDWQIAFGDLMMYSHQGQRIVYTVVEANVPAGYQSTVSQDGMTFTVTNTHRPTKPGQPTTPSTPGKPSTPSTPTTPSVPVTPSTPTTPNVPGTPVTPVHPGTPVVPGQPSVPAQSQAPVQPAQPGTPQQSQGQGQPQLPQTGNADGLALMALGLAMLSLTIGVVKLHD